MIYKGPYIPWMIYCFWCLSMLSNSIYCNISTNDVGTTNINNTELNKTSNKTDTEHYTTTVSMTTVDGTTENSHIQYRTTYTQEELQNVETTTHQGMQCKDSHINDDTTLLNDIFVSGSIKTTTAARTTDVTTETSTSDWEIGNETTTQTQDVWKGREDLFDDIEYSYESAVRPKCPGEERVNVTIDMAIQQLIDIDEPNQILEISAWMRLGWRDCNLVWSPEDYNGTDILTIETDSLWIPDITLYESVSEESYNIKTYRAKVYSDGYVSYNYPIIFKTLCSLDVSLFPFDIQHCALTFGAWTLNGFELDVTSKGKTADLSSIRENVGWQILEAPLVRHEIIYGCCPEPYPDVTLYLKVKRRPSDNVMNIIVPSVLIHCAALLGFLLPVDSGEKICLQVTVMLSISVFQTLVADKLPPSAEVQPLITIYLTFTLVLSGGSAATQVLVLNLYFRGRQKMTDLIKYNVLQPLSVLLLVPIPGLKSYCCKTTPDSQIADLFKQIAQKPSASDESESEPDNEELWKHLAIFVDKLGFCIFSVLLIIGSVFVFTVMVTS